MPQLGQATATTPSMRPAAILERSPVLAFLICAYAFAWSLWGYWVGAMPPSGLSMTAPFLICAIVGGFGPSLSGLLVSFILEGWKGGIALLAGLGRWRIGLNWYAFALLLVPALTSCSRGAEGRLLGSLQWPGVAVVPVGIFWPLMAALGEEFGWRGFLLPRLVPRLGLLGAALAVGLAWGFWHLPADYIGLKGYGDWFWAAFLLEGPILLTGHAVIMAWLWLRTSGNLLLMVLYHASITASAILGPAAPKDTVMAIASAALTAVTIWAFAIALIVLRRRDFAPPERFTSVTDPSPPASA